MMEDLYVQVKVRLDKESELFTCLISVERKYVDYKRLTRLPSLLNLNPRSARKYGIFTTTRPSSIMSVQKHTLVGTCNAANMLRSS